MITKPFHVVHAQMLEVTTKAHQVYRQNENKIIGKKTRVRNDKNSFRNQIDKATNRFNFVELGFGFDRLVSLKWLRFELLASVLTRFSSMTFY